MVPAMRASDLVLNHAVVHALFPGSRPLLSDVPLVLDNSPESRDIQDLLATHIANSWTDPGSRAATFVAPPDNLAYAWCKALFDDPTTMVRNSQALARLLSECMQTHPRITPGNLVICL